MRRVRAALLRMLRLFVRRPDDREFADELEAHLEMHIEDNIRAGMPPDEARRQALLDFGGVEVAKEAHRDRRSVPFVEHLIQDVRYAGRMMRRSPGFTLVVVVTMALGIGANSAMFSVINGVLLRQLPFPDADRLISVAMQHQTLGPRLVTWPDYLEWRDQASQLDGLAAAWGQAFNLSGGGEPERLNGSAATRNYFAVLGVAAQVGRTFTAADDRNTVVISDQLWRRRFGADPHVIGRSIDLTGVPHVVIGVMPPISLIGLPIELWVPIVTEQGMDRGYPVFSVIGRLKRQSTLDAARAELATIAARQAAEYPDTNRALGTDVLPLQERMVGSIRRLLLILLGAVACVLMIACVNVAALVLARSAARDHELSVRSALGASRSRIVRQLVTESVVLSMCGGVAGLILAVAALRPLLALAPMPRIDEIAIDGPVLFFTLATSLLTGVVAGLAPALAAWPSNLHATSSARGVTGSTFSRGLRPALIAIQIAAAVVLLTGAGLLMHSFYRLQQVETGFAGDRLLTLRFFLPDNSYPGERRVTFFRQLIDNISALPDVESAAAVSALPFGGASGSAVFRIPGRTPSAPGEPLMADFQAATSGYFRTAGIPLLRGRDFDDTDSTTSQFVAVVNRTMADRFFPGQDPIGQSVQILGPRPRTIVGIVQDVRERTLVQAPEPHVYVPHSQFSTGVMFVAVRARAGDPARLGPSVRALVRDLDPNVPIVMRPWRELLAQTLSWPKLSLVLLTMFAGVALTLSIVGIYGVLSFLVAQRTREIGIRMALGAASSDVLRLTIWQGLRPVAIGLAVGVPAALVATRTMQTMLFEIRSADPLTFISVAAVMVGSSLAATFVPARRASRVEPMVALRQE